LGSNNRWFSYYPRRASSAHRRPSRGRTALDEAKNFKAAGELSEDGLHDLEAEVQKLTDRFVKSVDDHLKHKKLRL
jgi:ribosome recycling factor